MNPAAYREMAETEASHWWFTARRAILASFIEGLALPLEARILELGCGTGGNLRMLSRFGRVSALELDDGARALAEGAAAELAAEPADLQAGMQQAKPAGPRCDIRPGSCPDDIPFPERSFDLVCLFDVLEHIERDGDTLVRIRRLLADGGRVLLTVPAYQWLYGAHDVFLHHRRRYSAGQLRQKIVAAGLRPLRLSYFNTLLFPLVALARLKDKMLGRRSPTATRLPPAPLNRCLHRIFAGERFFLARGDFPFGVSLVAVLQAENLRPQG